MFLWAKTWFIVRDGLVSIVQQMISKRPFRNSGRESTGYGPMFWVLLTEKLKGLLWKLFMRCF